MGKFSRDKGNRVERELVRRLQDHYGLAAERVPLSGAAGGRFSADLSVPLLGVDLRAEVKARATGFAQLYGWLGANDILIVKADRKPALVVLTMERAAEYARIMESQRGQQREIA